MNTTTQAVEDAVERLMKLAYGLRFKPGSGIDAEENALRNALRAALTRPEGVAEVSGWREINSMNLTDELVWLRKGCNIDGPRSPETDDYDRYELWAPCVSPRLAASRSPAPAEGVGLGDAEISLLELISELEDAAAERAHEMSGRKQIDRLVACRVRVSNAVRHLSGAATRPVVDTSQGQVNLAACEGGGVQAPTEPPKLYQQVIALTTDIDGDPIWVTATYNGEKRGYLGTGGHRLKPVTAWHALPPTEGPQGLEGGL